MAKRRKYGDAWKDVQIDAEQNDAVFDRFFKRSPLQPDEQAETIVPREGNSFSDSAAVQRIAPPLPQKQEQKPRPEKPPQDRTTVKKITPKVVGGSSGSAGVGDHIEAIKQQYRLSKGEAAILKHLVELAREAERPECYIKIPQLADTCGLTHRGCQFGLKNLQARGFILRVKDYDPADRLGIKYQVNVPFE